MGWSDFRCLMWLTWNTTPKISTPKLLPPADAPQTTLAQKEKTFFPLPTYLIFLFFFRFSCILAPCSFHPLGLIPPFFPSPWLLPCLRQGLPWGQRWQHNKAPGRAYRLDTRCIQLTRSSVSTSPHAQETHTHDPLLTDLTPTSSQTGRAPPRSVSAGQTSAASNAANYLFQVAFQSPVPEPLSPYHAISQEAQREDDKLSIRRSSGEFSSCLHGLWEPSLSRPHVCSREALIWLRLRHGRTRAAMPLSPLSSL